ncbi:hypothetical protein MYX04_13035, partial [Nitrospiraceae bacterium AH_259_D15_M11_P09]|nr:hypothetical protein [Nitrospiraceae bacterium AH_259_D15_M11_P09]
AVSNRLDHTVSLVSTASHLPVVDIPAGRRPDILVFSPDGTEIYVTSRETGTVEVIDVAKRKVVASIAVGNDPHGIVVRP